MTSRIAAALVAVVAAAVLTASVATAEDGKDLTAGAVWKFSADGGKSFDLPSFQAKAGEKANVAARAIFKVDDPAAIGGIWLVLPEGFDKPVLTLNGKTVPALLPGMQYAALPADASLLVKGENTLVITGAAGSDKAAVEIKAGAKVIAYTPEMIEIQTGPALGAIGPDYFTVICRTNMPAEVVVAAKPTEPAGAESTVTSKRGFYHRMKVSLPEGTREFTYTVTAKCGAGKKTEGPFTVKSPDFKGGAWNFVVTGDCRSDPQGWKAVSEAIGKGKPALMLFSGDMVFDGTMDEAWDEQFFGPARGLLATVPTYALLGNHDKDAAAFFELFWNPSPDGKAENWSQTIGNVLLIGIDGEKDWSAQSANLKWLDGVLKDSKAKFIFMVTHYPAWSSGTHGGRGEKPILQARQFIMPLLAKYKATAMIGGHDHDYERSEPPADLGVTCIVSGGAGAPLYKKSGRGSSNNPYSKVFVSTMNYCVFTVNGETCELKAYDISGKLLDKVTFKARGAAPAAGEAKKAA